MQQGHVWYFLPGMFGIALVVAAGATLGLSLLFLRQYRAAVSQLMASGGAGPSARSIDPRQASTRRDSSGQGVTGSALETDRKRRVWRSFVVYTLAGLGSAIVLAIGTLHDIEEVSFWRALLVVALHMGPLVFVAPLVLGLPASRRWWPAAGYVAAMFVYFLWRGTDSTLTRLQAAASLLFATFGPAGAVLALFFAGPVRAVAPTIMVFLTVALVGAMGTVAAMSEAPTSLAITTQVGAALGMSAGALLILLHLLAFAAFATIAWRGIRLLARWQARGRLSDQYYQVAILWLFFCLVAGLDMMFAAPGLFWLGPLASLVFLLGSSIGFGKLRSGRAAHGGPKLLILRVFAAGSAVERLFRFVDNRWRTLGEVCLIGGPDLAARTIEPRHMLDFLGKNLARTFISNRAQIEARVQSIRAPADATGRSRLHELYCRADMWQEAAEALVDRIDVVLMDLRRLSAERSGAQWEIGLLTRRVPLSRVLFVVDASTDRRILHECVARVWSVERGAGAGMPPLRLFEITGSPRDEDALWAMLMDTA